MQQSSKGNGQGFTLYLQEEMSSIYVSPTKSVAAKMREKEHIPNAPISLSIVRMIFDSLLLRIKILATLSSSANIYH